MKYAIDETELARLEYLIEASESCGYSTKSDDPNMQYLAAACHYTPALVAEVRRLREKVEALEWWDEVRQYTLFKHHPLWWADGHRTPEGNRYANAEKEYDEIRKAAFDDVYRGRPC